MKKKLILLLLIAALAQPAVMPSHITTEAATTGYEKKVNLLNTTQCIVLEPNYKADNSQHIQPGNSFKKDPYVKSEARYDAYCFARVEIPTTTFKTLSGKFVVTDAVKMLYNGNEGINTADWKAVKEIKSATVGTNSVYIFEYIGNGGVLAKQAATGRIFDSMAMPNTVNNSGTKKSVVSADDFTGAVTVQGYVVSTKDVNDSNAAYNAIKAVIEEDGGNSSNADKYGGKLQGDVDILFDERSDLEYQLKALEARIAAGLSTGDAKAHEVISGKIFSNSSSIGIAGTMPSYDVGYFGNGNTSDTYTWTDLDGKVHTDNKEGYQKVIKSGTGLTRNSDGTVTISRGYHAEQIVQGASGNASPDQVLNGVTYSNSSGPHVGTMPDNSTRTSNGNVPGINSGYSNIPTRDGSWMQYGVDTNGTARINICPPAGYYPGNGGSYVSAPAANFGNTIPSHVVSGNTFTSSAGLNIGGTMTNMGAYTPNSSWAVSGGKTYFRIPQGAYLTNTVSGYPEITHDGVLYSPDEYNKAYQDGYNAGAASVKVYVKLSAKVNDGCSDITYVIKKNDYVIINSNIHTIGYKLDRDGTY